MKFAMGVDLIEISRVRAAIERHGDKFLNRIYTKAELRECGGRLESLAARFAAKEAAAKALGCGIGDVSWQEIEIAGNDFKAPRLILRGTAEMMANDMGLNKWALSLSHTHEHAVAIVAAIG
jgi:holo-[acyl-carrier protein] synthase